MTWLLKGCLCWRVIPACREAWRISKWLRGVTTIKPAVVVAAGNGVTRRGFILWRIIRRGGKLVRKY